MDSSRFDDFARAIVSGFPRRRLLRLAASGGLVALLSSLGRPRPAAARTSQATVMADCECVCDQGQDCSLGECEVVCYPKNGVSGGGVLQLPTGVAVLALSATTQGSETEGQGLGLVRWVDETAGLVLESLGVSAYGPVPEQQGAREVRGRMQVNGEGRHPFVLQVFDAGPEQLGQDTAALAVGDSVADASEATGFSYAAEGTLVAGDLVGTWTLPRPTEAKAPQT